MVNMFSIRFDEYFLEKKFGQHLLTQVLPKFAFMLKIPVKNRPNHGMSKWPGGFHSFGVESFILREKGPWGIPSTHL